MTNYYRGEYGDAAPVRVLPAVALDFDGRLRAGYYANEIAAWAAILGAAAGAVEHAEERYRRANDALDTVTSELVSRRAAQRDITRNYQNWKRRHPMAKTG